MSHPIDDPTRVLRDAARERVLQAALACARRDGTPSLGIAGVAREAGVSRPTVYRYFRDRDELLRQTRLRAAAELADALAEHLGGVRGARARAVEALIWAADRLPADRVLAPLTADPGLGAFTGPEALALSRRGLAPLVDAAGWTEAEAVESIETMLRFLLSLLVAPLPERSEPRMRRFLARRLVPGLELRGRDRR